MPTTSNFGWTTPADTDYVKDGALAIRTLANGIDTSLVDLKGGTTGQILSKNSNTDLDYTWINNDQGDITAVNAGTGISVTNPTGPTPTVAIDSTVATLTGTQTLTNKTISASTNTLTGVINNTLTTTTGDIIYASSANTPARLGIGTTGQVLTVSGGVPTWAAAAGGSTFVGASVYNTAAQSISTATNTLLTFDSEFFDTDGFHSTSSNTSRMTIPSGKGGKYLINAFVGFQANATGYRRMSIVKNGTAGIYNKVYPVQATGEETSVFISQVLNLVATDYIEIQVYQTSGSTLSAWGGSTDGYTFSISYLGA